MNKDKRPLIILGIVALYYLFKNATSEKPLLGTRTMTAIKTFVDKLMPIALQVEAETGIRSFLGMAEAAHESNWGVSKLSDPGAALTIQPSGIKGAANNLFGFTAEPPTYWRKENRPYVELLTKEWVKKKTENGKDVIGSDGKPVYETIEIKRPFRAYPSWEESYRDWARLMQTAHYVNAGTLKALIDGDAQKFGIALNIAGYATDPTYGSKIVARIKQVQEALA